MKRQVFASRVVTLPAAVACLSGLTLLATACGSARTKQADANESAASAQRKESMAKRPTFENVVTAAQIDAQKALGDSGIVALGEGKFAELQAGGKVPPVSALDLEKFPASVRYQRTRGAGALAGTPEVTASKKGVIVGLPTDSLGLSYVFGGVITGVSDKESETLGGLKLSGLPTIVVRPLLSQYNGQTYLSLVGCLEACSEGSERKPILDIPVLGASASRDRVYVDLAPLSANLKIQDYTNDLVEDVTTKSTRTSLVDYSLSTLVFDVKSAMELTEKGENDTTTQRPFDLTTRYFLRMENALDTSFVARPQVEGVGYFTTLRSKNEKIARFSLTSYGESAPIHYYVKNVPEQWKKAFDDSFAAWAASFRMLTSRDILTWEHLEPGSELDKNIISGDVRYNTLEWDIANKAGYGGLGPSVSNETSGQLLSAQTLVQGPTIIELYSKWHDTWKKARELEAKGDKEEAQKLIAALDKETAARFKTRSKAKVSLGQVAFHVPAADDALRDPVVGGEFFVFPEDETYDSYMNGYFVDLVSHEIGHNLGLRHNFRGNLGRAGRMPEGRVSVSIMEYLDRNFRSRDTVGEYDVMALAYGYTGAKPSRKDIFCTDEQAADVKPDQQTLRYASPECSTSDATVDGYGYLTGNIEKAVDLLLAPSLKTASPWTPAQVNGRLAAYYSGTLAYYKAANDTFSSWTNWTGKPGLPTRPQDAKRARIYVLADFQSRACNADAILAAVDAKGSVEAKKATLAAAKEQVKFAYDFAREEAGIEAKQLANCKATLKAIDEAAAAE